MGSENSPSFLFDAVLQASSYLKEAVCFVILVTKETGGPLAEKAKAFRNIRFHFVDQVIHMEDEPLSAIRLKKNSSLVAGLRLLKKQTIKAFISLGNTGALLASSALSLPLLPGIKRPALLAVLPTITGHVSVLDVGGNISCKAHQLFEFAIMGACFEKIHSGVDVPKVGLLNVGAESKKGTKEHREAYQMLRDVKDHIQFIGNIEGFEVFDGKVEVLVTDGFTGNILLKTAEGLSAHILNHLKLRDIPTSKLDTLFSKEEHPGALLLGVDGLVIKCHGNSSAKALFNAIKAAAHYLENDLIEKMKAQLIQTL